LLVLHLESLLGLLVLAVGGHGDLLVGGTHGDDELDVGCCWLLEVATVGAVEV
jgi:hypothetical protein